MDILQRISQSPILHIIFYGSFYYIFFIALIRISGKRTLSEMNAFDFIVNIAIGSILSTVITDESIPLSQGIILLSFFIIWQFIITFLSTRIPIFSKAIRSQPKLVFYNNEYFIDNMKKERITKEEIDQYIRGSGKGSIEDVIAVVLESNGNLSVVTSEGKLLENLNN